MRAVVFKGVGNIALEDVKDPVIQHDTDAIIRLTMSTICGTDLHFLRGTIPGVVPGTILGHEGVGVVEKIGSAVTNFKVGDRVVVPSTIGCGTCEHCERGDYAQCDGANPNGPQMGTAFYGGPIISGPFHGMQAEKVRVPFADVNLVKIPDDLKDEEVILLSDILPTSYMAVEMADPKPDDAVAVFGCGPVGQLCIVVLKQLGVKNIIAIDRVPARLEMARKQGAQVINFDEQDPVAEIKKLTHDKGADRIIDAVGVDADHPTYSLLEYFKNWGISSEFKKEVKKVAPITNPQGKNWVPGTGPSQVLRWAVQAAAKTGTISIIGVYSEFSMVFPVGSALGKNLTVRAGNCNHRKYLPELLEWVASGKVSLTPFLTHIVHFDRVIDMYKKFDLRADGCVKVALQIPRQVYN
jgi:threonine dehydrogenase-like Zn-dependent dehydrogenase